MFYLLPKFMHFNEILLAYSEPSQKSKLERFKKIIFMTPDPTIIKYSEKKSDSQ